MFNNTGILVSDLDTFEKVYAENQAALGFDGYSKIQDSDKNWLISMCDEKNADGVNSKNPADFENKRDAVLKLTRDLQKAGVLLQSTYHAVCAMGAEGNYYNGIWVKNVEESEKMLCSGWHGQWILMQKWKSEISITATAFLGNRSTLPR